MTVFAISPTARLNRNRWDFVTRTFQMLVATINPRNPSGEAWMVMLCGQYIKNMTN